MPAVLPVHTGNNHWVRLIFTDNGVGSQSTFINPYTAEMFSLSSNAVVTDQRHLPVSHIKYPLSRIWAVESGREETKKVGGGRALLRLIIRVKGKDDNNNSNKKAPLLWCFSFHNILHQRWLHFKNGGKAPVFCLWHQFAKQFRDCPQGVRSEEIWNSCPIIRRMKNYPRCSSAVP